MEEEEMNTGFYEKSPKSFFLFFLSFRFQGEREFFYFRSSVREFFLECIGIVFFSIFFFCFLVTAFLLPLEKRECVGREKFLFLSCHPSISSGILYASLQKPPFQLYWLDKKWFILNSPLHDRHASLGERGIRILYPQNSIEWEPVG